MDQIQRKAHTELHALVVKAREFHVKLEAARGLLIESDSEYNSRTFSDSVSDQLRYIDNFADDATVYLQRRSKTVRVATAKALAEAVAADAKKGDQ